MSVRIRRVVCPVTLVMAGAGTATLAWPAAVEAEPPSDEGQKEAPREAATAARPIGAGSWEFQAWAVARSQPPAVAQTRRRAGLPPFEVLEPAEVRSLAAAGESGARLPQAQRHQMEPLIGRSLGDVRIHTGEAAARAAEGLSAEAFTIGRDIFFARGRYDPASVRGRALLAHELTHVRQQTGGESRVMGKDGEAGEAEARQTEQAVLGGAVGGGELTVGSYVRNYTSADGQPIAPADRARLDGISLKALEVCRQLLGPELAAVTEQTVPRVQVELSLDLAAMTDEQAAQVWGEAMARQVGLTASVVGASPGENAEPTALAVQGWGGEHKDITLGVVKSRQPQGFQMDPEALQTLVNASTDMDLRAGELWFNVRGFLRGFFLTSWLFSNKRRSLRELYQNNPEHARNHGEGGLYSIPKASAVPINVAQVQMYANQARAAFDQVKSREFTSYSEGLRWRRWGREAVLRNMADAFHVAQDRGSHGEGGINEGHDRNLADSSFKPDKPASNKLGWNEAWWNSYNLLDSARDMIYRVLDMSWTHTITYVQRAPIPGTPPDAGSAENQAIDVATRVAVSDAVGGQVGATAASAAEPAQTAVASPTEAKPKAAKVGEMAQRARIRPTSDGRQTEEGAIT